MSNGNNISTHPAVNDTALHPSMPTGWKIERRTLLGILLLTLILSAVYFRLLTHEFNLQSELSSATDRQLVSQIQHSSALQLQQLSGQINSQQDVIESVLNHNSRQLHSFPDLFARSFIQHGSIDYLGIYNPDRQPIAIWPEVPPGRELAGQINEWIDAVAGSGESLSAFYCVRECRQYQVSALQLNNETGGYLVASSSISGFLDEPDLPETRTMGVLAQAKNRATSTDLIVYKWGLSLYMGKRNRSSQNIVQEFAKKFIAIDQGKPLFLPVSLLSSYRLNVYPLDSTHQTYLFILDDVSSSVIARYRSSLIFSLLLFCTLIVFYYLVRKIHRNAYFSNFTSSGNYQASMPFRAAHLTGYEAPSSTTSDRQLNTVKNNNEPVNPELEQELIRLHDDRVLLEHILQNVQAIILTLKADGQICSVNPFAEKISGYSAAELVAGKFTDLQPVNTSSITQQMQQLEAITSGELTHYQHEAALRHKQNGESVILWQHTRLTSDAPAQPLILSTGIDISALKKMQKNLSWMINYDSLTSLFNRRRFEKELNSALSRAKLNHTDGTLLSIDLDNFTDINDSCGHKVGDIILRKVAQAIKLLTRKFNDSAIIICARLGGDEFGVILSGIEEEGAIQLSRRIIKSLNNITHMQRQVSFQLSSSIGIATFSDAGYVSNELLSNASFARNEAKLEGRNQLHTFKAEHSHLEKTHYRMFWREKIENALKTGGFILHFQPILNIHHCTISHYETLLRMKKEKNELVTPGLFIDIAEKSGLIQQIDSFIIATAIAKQGQLRRQGHDVTLAINLSSKAFDDPELFNKINAAIHSANANPEHLIFEITETGSVSNISEARAIMTQIQSLGCKFSLDDFGIGFSSFYHLRKLPFEYVKIDGSFVRDLGNNSDNKILVQALSEVAIGFNKLTVAEFVDSMQTLEILKQAKVNFAQGYLIGKPGEKIPVDRPDFFRNKQQ